MTELHFKGKEFVYNHHLTVPHRPLVMDAAKGIGTPRLDGNLIIQGDNLHALKALLPTHAGKVDCIFIDPPYNTGNEAWCYSDNVNSPMIAEWLKENFDPDTGKRKGITKEDGLRHDKWCAMMWPRLRLLWEILAEGGSLWVTLDDNEAQRAKLILDEVFGEDNFVANVIWQKKFSPANDAKWLSDSHDHLLVYAKRKETWRPNGLERNEKQIANYKNPDNDTRGPWASADCTSNKNRTERPNGWYAITHPRTGEEVWPQPHAVWRFTKAEFDAAIEDNRVWWGEGQANTVPRLKRFLTDVKEGVTAQTVWLHQDVGNTQDARREINAFGFAGQFETPKPTALLERVIELATTPNSVMLDSFAGSGTTAHAVLEANRRDGGNRRFILVEMEDYADRLTAERVRRVIRGYPFKGTMKTELHRESLTWAKLQRADRLTETVEKIETLHGHEYDRITKRIDGGELIVTGERTVDETAPGLGGEFTYCTLDDPIDMDRILSGEQLPDFKALGTVLFHTATNQTCDPALMNADTGYLGEAGGAKLWLVYKPDLAWLKTPQAALTLSYAQRIVQADPTARHIVFAPANHTSPSLLRHHKITTVEFAPLPYALYRVERG